jgi:hypothetical protein
MEAFSLLELDRIKSDRSAYQAEHRFTTQFIKDLPKSAECEGEKVRQPF